MRELFQGEQVNDGALDVAKLVFLNEDINIE